MEKYGIVFTGNEGVKLPMAYAKESIVYSREERKGLKIHVVAPARCFFSHDVEGDVAFLLCREIRGSIWRLHRLALVNMLQVQKWLYGKSEMTDLPYSHFLLLQSISAFYVGYRASVGGRCNHIGNLLCETCNHVMVTCLVG